MKTKNQKVKVCVEKLSHFNCAYCGKWWTVGDTPKSKKKWFCSWCGKEQK
jgi:transcription elongation factor Elf1